MVVRSLGWGIVVYAIMYLAWSGLVIYGLSLGMFSLLVRIAVLVAITGIAVSSMRLMNWKDVFAYSFIWAVVAMIGDALFLVPFTGWGLYASWSVWLGYSLIILAPVLVVRIRARRILSRMHAA